MQLGNLCSRCHAFPTKADYIPSNHELEIHHLFLKIWGAQAFCHRKLRQAQTMKESSTPREMGMFRLWIYGDLSEQLKAI